MSETKFKAGDPVKIYSTGRVGMIIDLDPSSKRWGILQFKYPNCNEIQTDLKCLKYKSKISIDVLSKKYFLTYLSEDKFIAYKQIENNAPKYDQLFLSPENIKYSIGDLVTIRSVDNSITGDFYYARSHPLQNCLPEMQAIVLKVSKDKLKCLINSSLTYGGGDTDLNSYNLPMFAKSWRCVYNIYHSAIIRKLDHFSLIKKPTCEECKSF